MADPGFIAAASNSGHATPATVTIPGAGAGVANGQRALLVLTTRVVTPTETPTGWTALPGIPPTPTTGSRHFYVYTAEIGSVSAVDPGATVSVPLSGSSQWTLAVYVAGASEVTATALNGPATMASSPPFNWTTPASEAADASRVVHIYGTGPHVSGEQPTWTASGSTTERVDVTSDAGALGNATQMIADEVVAAGATVGRTATATHRIQSHGMVVVLSVPVDRPTANAGSNQNVLAGATVNLEGSASGGAGGPFEWQWTQTEGPTVSLSPSNAAQNVSFTAPASTSTLKFQLVATDSASVASLPAEVTVSVLGPEDVALPIADIDVTGWTVEPDTMEHWQVIADGSDATYIRSEDDPVAQVAEFAIGPLSAPDPDGLLVVNIRANRVDATSGTMNAVLIQGASTVIAAREFELDSVIEDHQMVLTPEEIGNIDTPANDLRLRYVVTAA